MLDLSNTTVDDLEGCIRTALSAGQLSPGAQRFIEQLVAQGKLSQRDANLLSILNDAIKDGCVQRVPLV